MILDNVLILFFNMSLSSFPSTTYWRDCLFCIVGSWFLCHRLTDHKCMGLFLGFLLCFFMKVKEASENAGLKLNIPKTNIMASGPITSWQIDGETIETVTDFIFSGSKVIADGECSHEIKRHLLLGRKGMTNLDSTFKSRDIILPTTVHLVKAMVFPVVMYGCES